MTDQLQKEKILFKPLDPFRINQSFGENLACTNADKTHVIWCDGLNPPPGYKSIYGPNGHTGLDLRATHGQPFYYAQGGKITSVDNSVKSGIDVRVEFEIKGRRFRTIYEHLLTYYGKVGDIVATGQIGGYCDNTGYSSGDHLHFELQEWINGKWVPIDPMLYMANGQAKDIPGILAKIKEIGAKLADMLAAKMRK